MYIAFGDTYKVVPKTAVQFNKHTTFQTHYDRLMAMPAEMFRVLQGAWLSNYEVKVARTAAELDAEHAASPGGDLSPTFAVYLAAKAHRAQPLGIISAKKSATKAALGQAKPEDAVVYVGAAMKGLHVAASPFCITLDDRQFDDSARDPKNTTARAAGGRKRAPKPKKAAMVNDDAGATVTTDSPAHVSDDAQQKAPLRATTVHQHQASGKQVQARLLAPAALADTNDDSTVTESSTDDDGSSSGGASTSETDDGSDAAP
jgi:hypothetical protein